MNPAGSSRRGCNRKAAGREVRKVRMNRTPKIRASL
jgi:hypothetical protein